MDSASEIDTLKALNDVLSRLDDAAARDRVLKWAVEKFSSQQGRRELAEEGDTGHGQKKGTQKKAPTQATKKPVKSKASYSLVKDLNLTPEGKKSLKAFMDEKQPISNAEKCTLCIHYIRHVLELPQASRDHVYTCFKAMSWRLPSALNNTLAWVSSQKGWIDTSDMSDVRLTPHGENLIEHDLPRKQKAK